MIDLQSIEALISLMILVSISSYFAAGCLAERSLDGSLYRYQLVSDVWRVLWLREDLRGLDLASAANDRLVSDLEEIRQLTGMCAYLSGVRATSCTGQDAEERIGSVKKAVYKNGMQKVVTLTIVKQD